MAVACSHNIWCGVATITAIVVWALGNHTPTPSTRAGCCRVCRVQQQGAGCRVGVAGGSKQQNLW